MSQKSYPDPDNLKPGSLLFTLTEMVSDIKLMLRDAQRKKLFWQRAIAIGVWLVAVLLLVDLLR